MPGHTPLCGAAVCHCPPMASPASNTVTSKPASSAYFAAVIPEGPAPMTAIEAPSGSLTSRAYLRPGSGSVAATQVPRPAVLATSNRPPSAVTLSVMPSSP